MNTLNRMLLSLLFVAATLGGATAQPAKLQGFATPQAAADALTDAIRKDDSKAIAGILGQGWFDSVVGDRDDHDRLREKFLAAWDASHKVEVDGDKATVHAGTTGWVSPLPIVKQGNEWRYDVEAGRKEIVARRIGRNELAAIQTVLAITDAQEEFFAANPDGLPVKHFAQRAVSTPGKRDGLYWPTAPNAPESPLGPAFADARPGQAYHGYRYRLLTEQGKDAPGGARSYVRNGLMTEGYALIAWPERYGDTGVMTFIVSRDGVVYQKNLGRGTEAAARRIKSYNPDASWEKVDAPK